jgi:type VI secretion system protein ImpH
MAIPIGAKAFDIERSLIRESKRFSFVQAFGLLKQLVLRQGGDPDRDILIRPALTLTPAHAEVQSIARHEQEGGGVGYEMQVNLVGLYGAHSPLPHTLTERLIDAEQEDQPAGRLVLDLLHQRIYRLWYEAQVRFHPMADPAIHHTYLNLFRSLVGLRNQAAWERFPNPALLFQYLNIYRASRGSAAGLKQILGGLFEQAAVDIEQCVERCMTIPDSQSMRLGMQSHCLGDNALLGNECYESSGQFVVHIGPVGAAVYGRLIEDNQSWITLVSLIRYYLLSPLICVLSIRVQMHSDCQILLGRQGWSQLGADTWLYQQEDQPEQGVRLPVLEARLTID